MWRWCAGGRWRGAEARRAIKLKQTHDIVFSRHRAPGSLQGTDGRLCVLSQTSHQPPLTPPPTKASEKDAPSWCLQCHPVRDGGAGIFSLPMVISKHLICAVACPSRSDPKGTGSGRCGEFAQRYILLHVTMVVVVVLAACGSCEYVARK